MPTGREEEEHAEHHPEEGRWAKEQANERPSPDGNFT